MKFPGESDEYRAARDELLKAEIALSKETERVAALRRKLPLGGPVPEDYVFDEAVGETTKQTKLSELFDGKESLLLYSYMFGPRMKEPCPMCTSLIDGFDPTAKNLRRRAGIAIVVRSPIDRLRTIAKERGWKNLRLLSSANNTYHRDYFGEKDDGKQEPMLNVFSKRGGDIHHFWGSEMLYAPEQKGQDSRHVDIFWPLWQLLDVTPEGRGADWYPKLRYED